MDIRMQICILYCIDIHRYTYVDICFCTYIRIYTGRFQNRVLTCTGIICNYVCFLRPHTHMYVPTYTYIYTYTYTYTYICICTYIYVNIMYMYTHIYRAFARLSRLLESATATHIHTHILTCSVYSHTYTYTCIYIIQICRALAKSCRVGYWTQQHQRRIPPICCRCYRP